MNTGQRISRGDLLRKIEVTVYAQVYVQTTQKVIEKVLWSRDQETWRSRRSTVHEWSTRQLWPSAFKSFFITSQIHAPSPPPLLDSISAAPSGPTFLPEKSLFGGARGVGVGVSAGSFSRTAAGNRIHPTSSRTHPQVKITLHWFSQPDEIFN